ncbi:hypothetical protein GUITHDRAFT_154416 [Guillardia theta CCMP2712]|uniref:Uncharacterized protein n=1 Tax=Guillardia theta (strain CCMP2712) TaxID=905079 RepID=L1IUD3_GUITC|nr:hypothetical protein GUITHDRAFT_154416 [Guillardia theta CCMP2712]EKX39450.1 hypothetical protein GUITHDRAFT_154416 [Guillardia theta CCMP2712]|eukprot:XP_005826430.1 hypothetical protein GUITHDRAFT_154416 [Guillardia theta CCMP2712]
MFENIVTSSKKPITQSLYEKAQETQMLTASWLNGGYKTVQLARSTPYASGSIIPGSNYSAQDNHDSLKIAGL